MNRPDYYVCNGEKCDECRDGTFAKCSECSYCMFRLLPERVFPFYDPKLMDVEALHQILGDDFGRPPSTVS